MKRWVFGILLVVFSGLFLFSAYILGDYFLNSFHQQQEFDDLAQLMHSAQPPANTPQDSSPAPTDPDTLQPQPTQPELVQVDDPLSGQSQQMLPEFVELYALNDEIVGWISIPGTRIDYPVMQNTNFTDYYLYRGFDETYSRHGCIYVREVCDVVTPSDNVVIYGHRMGDGSMFNDLHKYLDEDFYREHNIISFYTLTQRHAYEILAVFTISSSVDSAFQYHLFVDAADEADFDNYISNCKAYSLYDTGVTAEYGDKLITLSTCEYTHQNGRLVVVAKRIT